MQARKSRLLVASLFALTVAAAGPARANVIVVTPYNPDGWGFSNLDNSGHNASGDFENGPGTPPLGEGSAQLIVNDSSSSEIFGMVFAPVAASTLTTLSYWTNVTTLTLGSGSAPNLEFDLRDSGGHYQGRLVFDPGLLGTVMHGIWQKWDASTADAWYFSAPGGACSLSGSYCTLSQALSHLSNINITDVLFKAGSGQSSFNGNVDDFTFNNTTYDFEVPEPGTLGLLGAALALGAGFRRRRRQPRGLS